MSRDPIQPNSMQGRNFVQRLLALINQQVRTAGPQSFQGRLTITANTHKLLWSSLRFYFMNTDLTSMYLKLKNCITPSLTKAEPSSYKMPMDTSPCPPFILDPSINQMNHFTGEGVPAP
jgi:hypothetical protein